MHTKFIFFSFLLFSSWSYTQAHNEAEYRDIPLSTRDSGTSGSGILRSIRIPAHAYIIGSELTLDFIIPLDNANVIITNLSTGEVVYSETLSRPQSIEIDLSLEDAGQYKLAISSGSCQYFGYFLKESLF